MSPYYITTAKNYKSLTTVWRTAGVLVYHGPASVQHLVHYLYTKLTHIENDILNDVNELRNISTVASSQKTPLAEIERAFQAIRYNE